MINSERAYNAYAESAGEINALLGQYRADVDNVKGINKQLAEKAKETRDLQILTHVGTEAGVRALKMFGAHYLGGIYTGKIPGLGVSGEEMDKALGRMITKKVIRTGAWQAGEKQVLKGIGKVKRFGKRLRKRMGLKDDEEGGDDDEGGDEGGDDATLAEDDNPTREMGEETNTSGSGLPDDAGEMSTEPEDLTARFNEDTHRPSAGDREEKEGEQGDESKEPEQGDEMGEEVGPQEETQDLRQGFPGAEKTEIEPSDRTFDKTTGGESEETGKKKSLFDEDEGDEDLGGGDEMGDEPQSFDDFMKKNIGSDEFDDFMNQEDFQTPMKDGMIDLDRSGDQIGMIGEDMEGRRVNQKWREDKAQEDDETDPMDEVDDADLYDTEPEEDEQRESMESEQTEETHEQQPEMGEEEPQEEGEEAKPKPNQKPQVDDEDNEEPEDEGEEGEGLGDEAEDLGKTALKDAGEDVVDEGIAGGLEGTGLALDATGALAPIGLLLNAAGFAVEAFTAFEAGKGVIDWFEHDILGEPLPKPPSIAEPKMPQTAAQRGQMIIPTTDTLDTQPTVGGW